MGTYNYSKEMIIKELTYSLDEIEGDFITKDLIDALEFLKEYSPTSDSSQKMSRLWKKKMEDLK